jgi:hypothetical protein
MKRTVLTVLAALATALVAQPQTAAVPLILSKDAAGRIIPNAVALELKSNPDCDQTARLIPDGSKLVSERFVLNVDDKGIGFFNGPANVVSPDGKIIIAGVLHGTVGLTAGTLDATKPCALPGHLEGMLTGVLASQPTTTTTSTDPAGAVAPPLEVNFQADQVQESAGIVPLYRARLVGLIPQAVPPPPPPSLVTILPSKLEYPNTEPIVAVIANRSAKDIQIFDGNSYCSIVQLQRRSETDWKPIGGCMLTVMPRPHVIKAGTVMKVILPEVAIPDFKHEPGVYRMIIDWQALDADGKGVGDFTQAVSPLFKVFAPPPPAPLLKVMPDKLVYAPAEAITAIIANGPVPVRIFNQQSLCTIVQLYRADGTNWVLEGPCPLDSIPIATILKAGEVKKVPLVKNSTWIPGRYRLGVTFAPVDATGKPTADDRTVFSEPFIVAPPPTVPMVTITPDRRSYAVTQPIVATIANASNIDVMTWDHRSFCTVINLQRQQLGAWKSIMPCLLMTPSMPVIIKAGQKLVVPLPGDPATNAAKWEPGVYRLQAVCAVPDSAGTVGREFEVASGPFTVGVTTTGVAPMSMEMSPTTIR